MLESENIYLGLHGFYLLEDDAERRLGLPSGEFDVPVMLRDCALDANGALVTGVEPSARTTVLANGAVTPYFPVARASTGSGCSTARCRGPSGSRPAEPS